MGKLKKRKPIALRLGPKISRSAWVRRREEADCLKNLGPHFFCGLVNPPYFSDEIGSNAKCSFSITLSRVESFENPISLTRADR